MKTLPSLMAMVGLSVAMASAQGIRKDDIARDQNGAPLLNKTVRVCVATGSGTPCNPTAPIFDNIQLGGDPIPNSQVMTGGSDGRYSFYVKPGRYLIQVLDGQIQLQLYPDVVLGNDPSGNLLANGNLVAGGPSPWFDATNTIYAGGASGSAQNTTGSIDFNLNPTRLTLAAAQDFKNGQGIAVAGAGPLPTITTPVGLAVVPQGTTGSTTYSYRVAAIDNKGGITAPTAAVSIPTASKAATQFVLNGTGTDVIAYSCVGN